VLRRNHVIHVRYVVVFEVSPSSAHRASSCRATLTSQWREFAGIFASGRPWPAEVLDAIVGSGSIEIGGGEHQPAVGPPDLDGAAGSARARSGCSVSSGAPPRGVVTTLH
jgi:hypothetical protein